MPESQPCRENTKKEIMENINVSIPHLKVSIVIGVFQLHFRVLFGS